MKTSKTHNYYFLNILFGFVLLCFISCSKPKDEVPWTYLSDTENLEAWTAKGGNATYELNNGIITGTTVANSPNTFLTTNKHYSDFILELDFKVDSSMNSGVQIRSNSLAHYQNGRVHGYQVEIDPSKRSWSGGIYDEGRRKWLYPLDNNLEAQSAFKQNEWNTYRVEAIGDTIKTWINSVPASFLIDEKTASGFIGLQVHSIRDPKDAGKIVQWKNIKILTDSAVMMQYSTKSPIKPFITKNKLTPDEQNKGWQLLWDGKTTQGWRGAKLDSFPEKGWNIENGELTVLASGGGESTAGGDIVTTEKFSDFELKVDFKITEGANSGIKYYVDTDINKGEGSSIGLEYQILDDKKHPDAKLGNHKGSRTIASLYDLIQADVKKPVMPIGEWNSARIVSKNNHVEHWLNGMKVLEYERKSEDYLKLVSESKYAKWPNFGELDKGNILLQDHGDLVSFKNIKIKSLN
ncbi:3-keto-disaccharide hydrolase [Spongiivirga citrea]|uniref:DUF1080 domain-containing protein n=1 Tax=Spongiivirga citrea TaxID=1481457 RepID=A0A6M0CIQ4_9FLAO|nr:DUF1080 domain-containing protein [Spongiivirga citrea]NER17828.1 DUF1080 domain-containing protein [Spongiivirga citrea]